MKSIMYYLGYIPKRKIRTELADLYYISAWSDAMMLVENQHLTEKDINDVISNQEKIRLLKRILS